MRGCETLARNTFQPAEVSGSRQEVAGSGQKVPVVRQFCAEKIDSDKFVSDRCFSPLKRGG
jgi:hypothetical protein